MLGANHNTQRANFYEQLKIAAESGLPLPRAFELMAKRYPRLPFEKIADRLSSGMSLGDALASEPYFSNFEKTLLQVSEDTSRLPEICQQLAIHFRLIAKEKRQITFDLLYSIFLLHAIVLLPSLKLIFTESLSLYLTTVTKHICIGYAIALCIGGCIYLLKHLPRLSGFLLQHLPLVGTWLQAKQQSYAFRVCLQCLQSGLLPSTAISIASKTLSSPLEQHAWKNAAEHAKGGLSFNEILQQDWHHLPEDIKALIQTGDISGRIDQSFESIITHLDQQWKQAQHLLVIILSRSIYAISALWIIFTIIQMWQNYIDQLNL